MKFTDIDSLDLRHISLESFIDEWTSIPLSEMEELSINEFEMARLYPQGI